MMSKKSEHFDVGTWILSGGRRGLISSHFYTGSLSPYTETYLQVRWEDGSIELIKPIALNRR